MQYTVLYSLLPISTSLETHSHAAINAQMLLVQISTTVYSQVLIHIADELEECRVKNKTCPRSQDSNPGFSYMRSMMHTMLDYSIGDLFTRTQSQLLWKTIKNSATLKLTREVQCTQLGTDLESYVNWNNVERTKMPKGRHDRILTLVVSNEHPKL